MAFCGKCGKEISDDASVCPLCGAPQKTKAEVDDIKSNKALAIISYIGFLFVIPIIMGKHRGSPYLANHVNQGIVLLLLDFLCLFFRFLPFIGEAIGGILGLIILIIRIVCIIQAVQGMTRPLPLIDKIRIIK